MYTSFSLPTIGGADADRKELRQDGRRGTPEHQPVVHGIGRRNSHPSVGQQRTDAPTTKS